MRQLFLILFAILGALPAYACRCHRGTFTEEVAQADQIFMGAVLKKTAADKVYYLFSVSHVFKGHKTDTLTIKTGFGGPDCGMEFETGKSYIVYASHKQTSWCRRNSLADRSTDLGKLKYLFQGDFSSDVGKTTNPVLTNKEAEYFNAELLNQRRDFDFHQKKIGFFLSGSFIDKEHYFKAWGGKDVANILIVLTEEEKQKARGYDAIIVSWRKQGVSRSFRKRLVKKLS